MYQVVSDLIYQEKVLYLGILLEMVLAGGNYRDVFQVRTGLHTQGKYFCFCSHEALVYFFYNKVTYLWHCLLQGFVCREPLELKLPLELEVETFVVVYPFV